jgi:predicted DNA-binding transcriptional regulator YafY
VQDYSDMENLTMWMLTFGDKVEVLEPVEVRERLKSMADNMIKMYGEKNGKN